MIDFYGPLLIGLARITVKDMCSSERVLRFKFDRLGIREFRTVVRQDHREQPTKELVPQSVVKPFENIYDRLRSVGIPKICKHETAFDKMDRQEAFAALLSNYGIHLHDVSVRIFFQESMKVLIVPPQTLNSGLPRLALKRTRRGKSMFLTSRSPASM